MGFMDRFKKKPARTPRSAAKEKAETEPAFDPGEGLYPLESAVQPWEITQMTQRFVEEARLIPEAGENSPVNQTSLDFMEQGLTMITFAQKSFQIKLTLSEQDIHQLEDMAQQAAAAVEQMEKEQRMLFAKLMAGYLGLLIGIHKGGQWVASVAGMEDNGPAIRQDDGKHYFVLGKVVRRVQQGEGSLVAFYCSIPYRKPLSP